MNTRHTIPSNWEWRKLDDIKISNVIGLVRNTAEQKHSNTYKYIKMNNISNDNKFNPENIVYVDASPDEVEKFSLKKGDFLFNTRNSIELVGKSCIFNSDESGILFNNNIMRIRFDGNISPYFIAYQFNSSVIKKQLEPIKSGTTNVAAIYYKTLKELKILVPLLEEQKRIVGKLDGLFTKADKAIALLDESIASASALLPSALNEVFGELSEKWEIKKFDEIKSSNTIGLVKNSSEQHFDYNFKYIKMNNITNDNQLSWANITCVNATNEEAAKFSLQRGDFLFNTRNSIELVGKICIFDSNEKNVLFNNNIMRVRFKVNILSSFIAYQFGSQYTKQQLEKIKSGTTNVAAIYYKSLQNINLIIPPLNIQTEVVAHLDAVRDKSERLSKKLKTQRAELIALKASLLERAFKGEL